MNTLLATLSQTQSPTTVTIRGGSRIVFSGQRTAKDIKAELKEEGLKGRKLAESVNEILSGQKSVRNTIGMAKAQALLEQGYVADYVDMTTNGAKMVFTRPIIVKESKSKLAAKDAEIEALKAELEALKSK